MSESGSDWESDMMVTEGDGRASSHNCVPCHGQPFVSGVGHNNDHLPRQFNLSVSPLPSQAFADLDLTDGEDADVEIILMDNIRTPVRMEQRCGGGIVRGEPVRTTHYPDHRVPSHHTRAESPHRNNSTHSTLEIGKTKS